MTFHFNLIDEPWIPVVDLQGISRQVNLRDALVNAHTYRQLSPSLPHTTASLIWLLLAVLHRIFRGPPDTDAWSEIWSAQRFDARKIDAYLFASKIYQRFDLFSAQWPFYQNRHPKVEVKPANALLFLVAGGDADTLFDHNIDTRPVSLSPQQAAIALVTAQSFGLAGLCHPQLGLVYTDASCARAIVFLTQGTNLFETLALNLARYNRATPIPWRNSDDPPYWEMDDPYHERTIPDGYLDYLTWQNRRISLIPSIENDRLVVREVTTAPGLVLNAEQINPMHYYSVNEKNGRKVKRFIEGRALWRDSSALLNMQESNNIHPLSLRWAHELIGDGFLPDRELTLAAYGMSTEPGKQKVYFYRGEQFEFPDTLLNNQRATNVLTNGLDLAERDVRNQLWGALHSLAELLLTREADLENGRKPAPADVQNLMDHWNADTRYWSSLEVPFFRFLDQLTGDVDLALDGWKRVLRKSALAALEQTIALCGTGQNSFKAGACAHKQLMNGIKKVLGPLPKEG